MKELEEIQMLKAKANKASTIKEKKEFLQQIKDLKLNSEVQKK